MLKRTAKWILLLSLGLLAGCATRPAGLLTPIGPAPAGASTVDLLVGTNRTPSPDPAVLFTGNRSKSSALAEIVVSIPPDTGRTIGQIQWPRKRLADPTKEFATVSVDTLDEAQINTWLDQNSETSGGHLLIFVPGFNTPFDGGVYLLAQLVHDSGMRVAPVLFAWPSRGKVLAYDYDRESATFSRTLLADIIERAVKSDKITNITILAHSMGGWLTMEALRTLSLRDGRVPAKIQNVILASPDIDVNVFYTQYQDLGPEHPDFTILVSRDDRALYFSRLIGGAIDRLGAMDIDKEPYKSALKDVDFRIFDLSKVRTKDGTRHLKFTESPDIVSIIGQSLVNGQKLGEDQASLRERLGLVITGGARDVVDTADHIGDKIGVKAH